MDDELVDVHIFALVQVGDAGILKGRVVLFPCGTQLLLGTIPLTQDAAVFPAEGR